MENRRFVELPPVERHEKLWRVLRRATDNRLSYPELRRIEDGISPNAQYHILIYREKDAFLEGITLRSSPCKDRSRLLCGHAIPGMTFPTFTLPSAIFRDETVALDIMRHSMRGRRELHIYLPDHAKGEKRHENRSAL